MTEQNGMFDRDAAREVLVVWDDGGHECDYELVLNALAGCVRPVPPQVIDRAAVADIFGRQIGVDPQLISVYVNRVQALVVPDSRFDTIRAIHDEVEGVLNQDRSYCSECKQVYPCTAVRALDGDPS